MEFNHFFLLLLFYIYIIFFKGKEHSSRNTLHPRHGRFYSSWKLKQNLRWKQILKILWTDRVSATVLGNLSTHRWRKAVLTGQRKTWRSYITRTVSSVLHLWLHIHQEFLEPNFSEIPFAGESDGAMLRCSQSRSRCGRKFKLNMELSFTLFENR